jgi:anti-anti-sigma regulatory factor
VAVEPGDDGGVVLRVDGDLDGWTGATLQMIVQQQRPDATVSFDLSGVLFLDRAGLRALLATGTGPPHVLATSPAVDRLLALTRVLAAPTSAAC